MNRLDFQRLAEIRITEAEGLLTLGQSNGAYYLSGYAIECALKACIAKLVQQHDFPPPRKFVEDCYNHDLSKLLVTAKLADTFKTDEKTTNGLKEKWQTVQGWSEQARYEEHTQQEAAELIDAIVHPTEGVLRWVKNYW